MKLQTDEEGVSPVIGVILMVAITVALAAVVYVLVSDLGGDPPEVTPNVTLEGDGSGDYTVLRADNDLLWEAFIVTGCTTVPTGSLDAGDVLLGCSASANMVHRESNSIVWQA